MNERCPVTFVNTLEVSGFSNGIVNLAFSTAGFVPRENEGHTSVVLDGFISSNLRMDLFCAQQLHDSLGKILAQQTKPAKLESVN